jgi:thymidylate synthase (FAD)
MFKMFPQALLVTKPVFDLPGFSNFIKSNTGLVPMDCIDSECLKNIKDIKLHGDFIPMMAGKLCYLSFNKDKGRNNPKDHLGHIIECKHGSVLEHTNAGFILMTSRDISHEIVRHRLASYSQLSQRYVDSIEFLIPPELHFFFNDKCTDPNDPVIKTEVGNKFYTPNCTPDWFIRFCRSAAEEYNSIADELKGFVDHGMSKTEARKIVNQTARAVLPNATITYIFMTANIRSWRTILESRCSKHAATGIRWLFNQVFQQLKNEFPACFQDYTKIALEDGSFEIKTTNPKV